MSHHGRGRSPKEVEERIRHSRQEIDKILSEIERRLSPEELVPQVISFLRQGREAFPVADAVRNDPIPLLLTGVGISWLMASGLRSRRADAAEGAEGEGQVDQQERGGRGGPVGGRTVHRERRPTMKAEESRQEASPHADRGQTDRGEEVRARLEKAAGRTRDFAGEHTWAFAATGVGLGIAAGVTYWLWSRRDSATTKPGTGETDWGQRDWEEREFEGEEGSSQAGWVPEGEGEDTVGAGMAEERLDAGLWPADEAAHRAAQTGSSAKDREEVGQAAADPARKAGDRPEAYSGSSNPPPIQKNAAANLKDEAIMERRTTTTGGHKQ